MKETKIIIMVFFSEELEIFEVEDYDRSVIISEFLQLSPTGKQLAMLEVDFFKCNEMAVHPESMKNTKFYHLRNTNFRILNSPRMRRNVPIKSKLNRQLVTMRNNKTTKDTKNITNTTNASTSSESERSDDKDQEEIETKTVPKSKSKGKLFFQKRIFSRPAKGLFFLK